MLQAPVPYMNRALAKEALGVEAARSGDTASAASLYRDALQVVIRDILFKLQHSLCPSTVAGPRELL